MKYIWDRAEIETENAEESISVAGSLFLPPVTTITPTFPNYYFFCQPESPSDTKQIKTMESVSGLRVEGKVCE